MQRTNVLLCWCNVLKGRKRLNTSIVVTAPLFEFQLTAVLVAKGLPLRKDLVRESHSKDLSSIKTCYARRNTHSNAYVLYRITKRIVTAYGIERTLILLILYTIANREIHISFESERSDMFETSS